MVIYCDAESAPRLAALRARVSDVTQIIVLPLSQTDCGSGRTGVNFTNEHARDPEAHLHSPALYEVWNEKSAFVRRVMESNPFHTDTFAWCDIGCFRSDLNLASYRRWPEGARLDAVDPERLVLLLMQPFQPGELAVSPATGLPPSFERVIRVGGTIMVGHRRAWERWIPAYYNALRRFAAVGMFAGKDQNVMAAMCALHPEFLLLVTPTFIASHGDPWFFLQPWFSLKING